MPFNDYISKKFGQGEYKFEKSEESSPMQYAPVEKEDPVKKATIDGVNRGMSGGISSALMSGGISNALAKESITGMNGAAMGAGLGLALLQQNAQADQAEEDAKQAEAQQRKQNQLAQINNLMSVSRGLSLGA